MLIFYPGLIVLTPIKVDVVSWAFSKYFRSRPVCQLYPRASSVPAGEQPWDQIWDPICSQKAVGRHGSQCKRRFDRSRYLSRYLIQEKISYPNKPVFSKSTINNAAVELCMGCLTVLTHHGNLFWLCWVLASEGDFSIPLVAGCGLVQAGCATWLWLGSCHSPGSHTQSFRCQHEVLQLGGSCQGVPL